MEEWRDIEGYEGLYQVSSLGRVKSLDRTITYKDGRVYHYTGKILNPSKAGNGYMMASLCGGKVYIHRLVAQAFIENPNCLSMINHKNGLRDDNRVENLEWINNAENIKHGYRTLRSRETTKVKCVETGEIFESVNEAAEKIGRCHQNIFKVLNGERHTCGGFHWVYVE